MVADDRLKTVILYVDCPKLTQPDDRRDTGHVVVVLKIAFPQSLSVRQPPARAGHSLKLPGCIRHRPPPVTQVQDKRQPRDHGGSSGAVKYNCAPEFLKEFLLMPISSLVKIAVIWRDIMHNRSLYTFYIEKPRIQLLANSVLWWRWMRKRQRKITLSLNKAYSAN
jgi:hypothetical protein